MADIYLHNRLVIELSVTWLKSPPYHLVTLPDEIQACLTSLHKKLTALLPLSDHWPEVHPLSSCDLHLSLSRTVPILHHWIEPLTTALKKEIEGKQRWVNYVNMVFILKVRSIHQIISNLLVFCKVVYKLLSTFYEEIHKMCNNLKMAVHFVLAKTWTMFLWFLF